MNGHPDGRQIPADGPLVIAEHRYGIGYLTMACPKCNGFRYSLNVKWTRDASLQQYVWTAVCQRCGNTVGLWMAATGDWPPNLEMGNPAWPRFQRLSAEH